MSPREGAPNRLRTWTDREEETQNLDNCARTCYNMTDVPMSANILQALVASPDEGILSCPLMPRRKLALFMSSKQEAKRAYYAADRDG